MSSSKRVQGFAWTVADHDLLATSDTWGDALVAIAQSDKRVVAVTADLATTTKLARMKREMPGRVINVGVAEQNLVAVAAGLAATGLVPIVVTYATFASLRAAEFVRTDVAYNARDVKIIGTLAGVAFGQGGPTHHTVEDIAFMRAIPGMVVLSPSDGDEMGAALRAAVAHEGPVYIRYGRGTEAPVRSGARFVIGDAITLREGDDIAVLATGSTVSHAVRAAERLASSGVQARVVAFPTLKPLDADAIVAAARETKGIVTVEDHNVVGGLGSAVADVLAQSGLACAFRKLGHPDRWLPSGVPEDLMHSARFDEDAVVVAAAEMLDVAIADDEDWSDA